MVRRRTLPLLVLLLVLVLLQTWTPMAVFGSDEAEVEEAGGDASKVELVENPILDTFSEDVLGPGTGVETAVYFPNNPTTSAVAGEPTEIVVGIDNNGEAVLKVEFVRASLILPHDHRIFVQNFTAQEYGNTTVPSGVQSSFSYSFTVHKNLQPGSFDLLATVVYKLDDTPHRSVFYNSTIEVVEASGFVSGETLFLVTLGLGLLGLLGMWVYSQVEKLSKKQRRANKKVELGTRSSVDSGSNEWLQGTSFTQKISRSVSQQRKSQKKK